VDSIEAAVLAELRVTRIPCRSRRAPHKAKQLLEAAGLVPPARHPNWHRGYKGEIPKDELAEIVGVVLAKSQPCAPAHPAAQPEFMR